MNEFVYIHTPIRARDFHRPATPEARRPAILELHRRGLKPRDVAQALRVDLGEVLAVARGQEGAP